MRSTTGAEGAKEHKRKAGALGKEARNRPCNRMGGQGMQVEVVTGEESFEVGLSRQDV